MRDYNLENVSVGYLILRYFILLLTAALLTGCSIKADILDLLQSNEEIEVQLPSLPEGALEPDEPAIIVNSGNQHAIPISGTCPGKINAVTIKLPSDLTLTVPCSGGQFNINLDLSSLPEGTQTISIESSQEGIESKSVTVVKKTISPSVVVSSAAPVSTKSSPIPVTVTFSEFVTGFNVSDVTVTNGTVSEFEGGGSSYTFSVIPVGQGAVTIAIAAGKAQDSAGNFNSAATTLNRIFDSVSPTVTLSMSEESPTKNATVAIVFSMSESVTRFDPSDITVTNGSVTSLTGSGSSYTANVTALAAGTVSVSVGAGRISDAATNTNEASNTLSWMYDNVSPVVPTVTNATNTMSASLAPAALWSGASDEHSGINRYEIAIGTSLGGSDVKAWASVGTGTSNSVSGLSLSLGGAYYISIRVVDNAGNVSTAVSGPLFRYLPSPTVAAISPVSGIFSGGTSVTITGTGFSAAAGGMVVTIGGGDCGSVNLLSATSLTCITGANSVGAKTVSVTNGASLTGYKDNTFTYTDPCAGEPAIATTCVGGALYAGTWSGYKYMTTPAGCTDSANPTCGGGPEKFYKYWHSGIYTGPNQLDSGTDSGLSFTNSLAVYADAQAAMYCYNMSYGGYSDWFLPSWSELTLLYNNKSIWDSGIGAFANEPYWTPNNLLVSDNFAINMNMGNGNAELVADSMYGTQAGRVRCVRRY